ncbi:MAG: SDR family NAD(P)-dependent oxidoreductase, partial [Pseudomonadota bacterium]
MNILITGASGGFGTLFATDLVKAGHNVVGTVRDAKGRNAGVAQQLEKAGARVVELDVADDQSVEAGVAQA